MRQRGMTRRDFAALATAGVAAGPVELSSPSSAAEPRAGSGKPSFRDVGWVWEGQGIDPKVPPSIYGLGQGARYFGLSRANYLFHPNDVHRFAQSQMGLWLATRARRRGASSGATLLAAACAQMSLVASSCAMAGVAKCPGWNHWRRKSAERGGIHLRSR